MSRLCTAVSYFLYDQFSSVSPTAIHTLEQPVQKLSVSLDEKERQVGNLEAEIVSIKISSVDSVLKIKSSDPSTPFSAPTYASITRVAPIHSTLVARCFNGQASAASVDLFKFETGFFW